MKFIKIVISVCLICLVFSTRVHAEEESNGSVTSPMQLLLFSHLVYQLEDHPTTLEKDLQNLEESLIPSKKDFTEFFPSYEEMVQLSLRFKKINHVNSLNSFAAGAYLDDQTNTLVIAFRGGTGMDTYIFGDTTEQTEINKNSNDFLPVQFIYDSLKMLPEEPDNLVMTGHSLGGFLAQLSTIHLMNQQTSFSVQANTFNTVGFENPNESTIDLNSIKGYNAYLDQIQNTGIYDLNQIMSTIRELKSSFVGISTDNYITSEQWENRSQPIYKNKIINYLIDTDVFYTLNETNIMGNFGQTVDLTFNPEIELIKEGLADQDFLKWFPELINGLNYLEESHALIRFYTYFFKNEELLPTRKNVPQDKIWNVTFNTSLLSSSINRNTVHVLNKDKEVLDDVVIKLKDDNRTISIEYRGYISSQTYYLSIDHQIRGENNKNMLLTMILPFIIE